MSNKPHIFLPKRFTGLHAHDGFSVFDGMGLPQEHFDFVRENSKEESSIPALAITNHGNMNSYAHAHLYAKQLNATGEKFKFLPGCEIYLHPDLNDWKSEHEKVQREREEARKAGKKVKAEKGDEQRQTVENEEESKSGKFYDPLKRKHHLVVLAKHSKGLGHLFHTVSRSAIEGFYRKPRVDLAMLKKYKGSFVASTACIAGPLAYEAFSGFQDKAFEELLPSLIDDPILREKVLMRMENMIDRLVDTFGEENFFLELQFNKLGAQHLVNRCLIELADRTGIKLIASADSHYCKPEYWRERALYQKLGWLNYSEYDSSQLPDSVDELKAELYPKNAKQMWDEYKKTTEKYDFYDDALVAGAIERSHDVAFDLIEDVTPDTKIKLPSYTIPKNKTAPEALRDSCMKAMKEMGFDKKKEYVDRLETELEIIIARNFCEYFITMKAIIDIASDNMLIGCGRGSGAGSLINYLLGITQVDPLKYDLIFERFISKHRKEMPDIDTDIGNRDLLIDLMKKEFGDTNVIPISNYNTFQLKSLVKDISRFYEIPFDEVNLATKTLDADVRKATLSQGDDKNLFQLKYDDGLQYCAPFREFIESYPQVGEHIKVLFKQNKSLGKHAGGVIVSENIPEKMPLILSKKVLQTPWVEGMHFKHLEHLGFVKFDLLGLETLRIIQRCIELILKRHGEDLIEIELDDGTILEASSWQKIKLTDGRLKLVAILDENDDILTPVELA